MNANTIDSYVDDSGLKAFTEGAPKITCRDCARMDAGKLRRCKTHHRGTGHEAGKILRSRTGAEYQVQHDGSFRRVVTNKA